MFFCCSTLLFDCFEEFKKQSERCFYESVVYYKLIQAQLFFHQKKTYVFFSLRLVSTLVWNIWNIWKHCWSSLRNLVLGFGLETMTMFPPWRGLISHDVSLHFFFFFFSIRNSSISSVHAKHFWSPFYLVAGLPQQHFKWNPLLPVYSIAPVPSAREWINGHFRPESS